MEATRRIFITGTNRGLGRELVKLLASKHPELELHISSRKEPQQLKQEWEAELPKSKIQCYQIDLNDPNSLSKAAEALKQSHTTFDFLVANAAYGCDYGQAIPSVEIAESTLKTNVNATVAFIKQFLPLLSVDGRVVIVSSTMGNLEDQKPSVRKLLEDPSVTEEKILELSLAYIEAAKKKEMGDFNWSAYKTSKCLINAWTRFILP
jgi:short-subunit dehydrogenase